MKTRSLSGIEICGMFLLALYECVKRMIRALFKICYYLVLYFIAFLDSFEEKFLRNYPSFAVISAVFLVIGFAGYSDYSGGSIAEFWRSILISAGCYAAITGFYLMLKKKRGGKR